MAFTTIAFQQFNYTLIIYPLLLFVNCVEPFLMRKICLPCVKGDFPDRENVSVADKRVPAFGERWQNFSFDGGIVGGELNFSVMIIYHFYNPPVTS